MLDENTLTNSYTANYKLNYLTSYAYHKEILVNHNFTILDSIIHHSNHFLSRSIQELPNLPKKGDCYLIPAKLKEGSLYEKKGLIAMFINDQWSFFKPKIGHISWVSDEKKLIIMLEEDTWYEIQYQK